LVEPRSPWLLIFAGHGHATVPDFGNYRSMPMMMRRVSGPNKWCDGSGGRDVVGDMACCCTYLGASLQSGSGKTLPVASDALPSAAFGGGSSPTSPQQRDNVIEHVHSLLIEGLSICVSVVFIHSFCCLLMPSAAHRQHPAPKTYGFIAIAFSQVSSSRGPFAVSPKSMSRSGSDFAIARLYASRCPTRPNHAVMP